MGLILNLTADLEVEGRRFSFEGCFSTIKEWKWLWYKDTLRDLW